jgi:hypothetical protein
MKVGFLMKFHWKSKKTWEKLVITGLSLFLLLVIAVGGFLYYTINQVDLEGIEKRIEERKQDAQSDEEQAKLPGVLDSTIDKAESLTTKSIDPQDALDVAAILLKSGLSMKEMYYLTGKSTDKLSNDEKQKIRDLLLKKLSPEEIKALRAITYDYGKKLVILDPEYPIELVGVYDEAEQARIRKELEDKKKLQATATTASPNPVADIPAEDPLPSLPPSTTPIPSGTLSSEQTALHDTYQGKLDTLQNGCTNKVSSLAAELSAEIKAGQASEEGISIASLQSKFLPKIEAAEQECDSQFNNLMNDAANSYQEKGLPLQDIENWKSQYEAAKRKAQSEVLNSLMSSISK